MYRMIGADGREYGPVSAEQLRQWIGQGRANAATSVLPEGTTEWKPLGSLPEFSMQFAAPATQPVFANPSVPTLRTSGFAVAGLVSGIFALTFGLCCCYGLPFSLAGITFSLIAINQINSQPERFDGKTMAFIAIGLCCLSLLIAVGLFLLGFASVILDPSSHHVHRL